MGHLLDTGLARLSGARAAIVTALACIAICLPLGFCQGQRSERAKWIAEREAANARAVTTDAAAREQAATERAADTATIAEKEREQRNAIQGDTDADIRRSAACQRLRQARGDQAAASAGC